VIDTELFQDTEIFWRILEQGIDVSRRIPADRFDIETHFDPTGKQLNKSMTEYGCFIDEPGAFDAPFFNMSPREAQIVDPQMRLALVTAYEALERSGYVENRTFASQLERIGTWYGQAADVRLPVQSCQGSEDGVIYFGAFIPSSYDRLVHETSTDIVSRIIEKSIRDNQCQRTTFQADVGHSDQVESTTFSNSPGPATVLTLRALLDLLLSRCAHSLLHPPRAGH